MAVSRRPQASGRWRRGRTSPSVLLLALPVLLTALAGPVERLHGFFVTGSRPLLSSRPAHKVPTVALRAQQQAKQAHPVTKLETVVGTVMRQGGWNASDIDYTYMTLQGSNETGSKPEYLARVQFNCLPGQPSLTGPPQSTETLAKRAVAEAALKDPDFLVEMILSSSAPPKKQRKGRTQRNKSKNSTASAKAPKASDADDGFSVDDDTDLDMPYESRTKVADVSIGQELTGVVKGWNNGGVFLDAGLPIDAYLPVAEMCEGFPTEDGNLSRRKGTVLTGRVIFKAEDGRRLWITRRPGDLQRPQSTSPNFNGTAFRGVDPGTWYPGKVTAMAFDGVKVEVKDPPGGGSPVTGNLREADFSGDFRSKAKLGMDVRVRVRYISGAGRLEMTMLEVAGRNGGGGETTAQRRARRDNAEARSTHHSQDKAVKEGMELEGVVRNAFWRPKSNVLLGAFLDIGASRDALLTFEEFNDGFPVNISSVTKKGTRLKVRVLRVDEQGKIFLTRRSGDLARSPAQQYVNTNPIDHFQGVSSDEWFEGEVIRMLSPSQVIVNVTGPAPPRVSGLLLLRETTRSFKKEAKIGMTIKVRILKVDTEQKRLRLTMRSPGKKDEAAGMKTPEAEAKKDEPDSGGDVPPAGETKEDDDNASDPPAGESPSPSPPNDLFSFLSR